MTLKDASSRDCGTGGADPPPNRCCASLVYGFFLGNQGNRGTLLIRLAFSGSLTVPTVGEPGNRSRAAPVQPGPCQPIANQTGVSCGRWRGQGILTASQARGCFPRGGCLGQKKSPDSPGSGPGLRCGDWRQVQPTRGLRSLPHHIGAPWSEFISAATPREGNQPHGPHHGGYERPDGTSGGSNRSFAVSSPSRSSSSLKLILVDATC